MLRQLFSATLVLFGLLAFGVVSQAAVVLEHVGGNNPTDEGWGLFGTPGQVGLTGELPNWRTQWDNVPPSNFYRVVGEQNPALPAAPVDEAVMDPSGWTATWKVQVVEASSYSEIYFNIHDGSNLFEVRLYDGTEDPQGAYAFFGMGPQLALGTVDPTDGFHTYQIVLDPGEDTSLAGRIDDVISYYVDGVERQTFYRSVLPGSINPRAEFGIYRTGYSYDETLSDVRHNLWRLETGQNPCTPGDALCPLPPAPTTTGDYNGDGTVDAADYTMWQDTLGNIVTLAGTGADGDESGTIDAGDYTFWSERFGDVITSGTTASVPEPCSLMLMSLVMINLMMSRFGRPRKAGRMGWGG